MQKRMSVQYPAHACTCTTVYWEILVEALISTKISKTKFLPVLCACTNVIIHDVVK